VLIDADFRHPTLHDLFDRPNTVGLSSVLTGRAGLPDAVQETAFPNLRLLAAGPFPHNPAECLSSSQMTQVLGTLTTEVDLALIDTPAFLGVTDAASVATKTDGVLLVAARGRVTRDDLRSVLGQLQDIGAQTVGLVVTGSVRKAASYRGDAEEEDGAGLLQVVNE
jgi:capsular exopolysaccharide synthesis family protein